MVSGRFDDAIAWFEELGRSDIATAGGKGANLGELTRAGLPVPPGFVVTAAGYLAAMEQGGVRERLRVAFADALRLSGDPTELAAASATLRALVRRAGVPEELRQVVVAAYRRLGDSVPVAVRSSATAEDTAGTSFAGMHETFANVVGDDAVLERLVDCWASLYGERVIAYRASQGLDEEPAIAVVVQQLIDSERAGVMFTADPSTNDRSRIVIEAAFGLGEVVVSGQVEPDTYTLTKEPPTLVSVRVGRKDHQLVSGPDGTVARVELDDAHALRRVLTDELRERGGGGDADEQIAARHRVQLRRAVLTELRGDGVGVVTRIDGFDGVADLPSLREQLERRGDDLAVLGFGVDPDLCERHGAPTPLR